MKLNWKSKLVGNLVVLVPYQRHHVEKYHQWMKSEELQELTGSEPLSLEEEYSMQQSWKNDEDKCTFIVLDRTIWDDSKDEIKAMIGDTNLFLTGDTRDAAEAEVMIAETWARGKGRGREALTIMLRYGMEALGIKEYIAKIKMSNTASINLFQKLGFVEVSRSEVFQELTFSCDANDDFVKTLKSITTFKDESYSTSEAN